MTEYINDKDQLAEDIGRMLQIVRKKIKEKDYVGALEMARSLSEKASEKYESHYLFALILKMLHYEEEAMAEIYECIDLDPSDFSSYELALILFIRHGDYEFAHQTIDLLVNSELGDYISIRWCKAWLDCQEEKNDYAKTMEIYSAIAEELEASGEDYYWIPDFYFQYADLLAEDQSDAQILIDILDKGLKSYPDDASCLDYKAWLLKRMNRKEEARIIYEKMVAESHIGIGIDSLRNLASIYYGRLAQCADKALKIYQFLLKDNERADDHFYAGMCEFSLGNLEEAEKHFLREQEMAPDDVDGYFRLSYVYEVSGRLEEALVQIDKSLDLVRTWGTERDYSEYFEQKAYILRKMGNMTKAADTILEAKQLYGERYKEYPVLVDIWEQAGNWTNTKNVLNQWKKAVPNVLGNPYEGERCAAQVNYYLLRKQFLKARLYYMDRKDAMSEKQADNLAYVLDSISGKADKYLEISQKIYKNMNPENMDYPWAMGNYAEALWLNGQKEKACEMAQTTLDRLDKDLKGFHRNRTVYMVQRAGALLILGRFDEADEELKAAKNRPMCDLCACGTCKDVDIYRVREMIHRGMRKEALELTREYQQKWPDELDFIFYQNLLR